MSTPLERSVRVCCSVQKAFDIFTSQVDDWWPKSHRRFEDSSLCLEAKEGGHFLKRSRSGEEVLLGEVLLYEPPKRIVYSWYPGAITQPTQVEVRFTTLDNHTLVEITHREAESALGDAWPQRVGIFARAWDEVLPAWAEYADNPQEAAGSLTS